MTQKQSSKPNLIIKLLDIEDIDPSPFQRRKYFNADKLKELADSIRREGLIEPIVVRPHGERYQLIAGERRWRAIRDHTDMEKVQAQVVMADDLRARRMAAAENLQREDLSAIETIETIVEIVDVELIEDAEYAAMGKTPVDRVKVLLGKLDVVRASKARNSEISHEAELLFYKFVEQVQKIFRSLPKPLQWLSFYLHDLPLLMDYCKDVREVSIQYRLNKSQTRALSKLKQASAQEFDKIANRGQVHPASKSERADHDSWKIGLRDLSAKEIEEIAQKAVQKETRAELSRICRRPVLNLEVIIFIMSRLGIPADRIATHLKLNSKTVRKHSDNPRFFQSILESLDKGSSVSETARKHGCPVPLVWSLKLEGKSDQERFKSLNWGLRTWDHWYFNEVDQRFGDDWPGRIPAQLVAHTLFYFTREGDLVLDPMAGGGVVADTCLAFHRKCWSFDMEDRPDTRPEIEYFQWNPRKLKWPLKGKEKPDLIFFDPPYFTKLADQYSKESISSLSRKEYLKFLQALLSLAKEHSQSAARIAFLNADWRDFQSMSALEEDPGSSIRIDHYIGLLKHAGWTITHIVDCPLSTQRFQPTMVSRMQKNRTLGVIRRSLIVGRKK